MASPVLVQAAFRGRNDDVGLNVNTWNGGGGLNGNWTQQMDVNFRIRFRIDETNSRNANVSPLLEYNRNGGGWNTVPTTAGTNPCWLSPSSESGFTLTDDDQTTASYLGATSFVNGRFDENGAVSSTLINNQQTEYEYCVQINSAGASVSDTIQFRVSGMNTYSQTPTVTASAGTISGTLAKTLGTLTSSAAGALPVTGSLAKTLGTLTSSAAGALPVEGATTKTLGTLTASAAGGIVSPGRGPLFLPLTRRRNVLIALPPVEDTEPPSISGSLAKTLGALTSSAAGTVNPISGSLAKTLDALTASAAGDLPITGSAAQTLAALSLSAAAEANAEGTLAKTLDALTATAAGELPVDGTLAKTLDALATSGTQTVLQDEFDEVSDTDLTAHSPNINNTGNGWQNVAALNPAEIMGGGLAGDGLARSKFVSSYTTGYGKIDLGQTVNGLTITAIMQGYAAAYYCYLYFGSDATFANGWRIAWNTAGSIFLQEITSGTPTARDSGTPAASAAKRTIEVSLSGSNIAVDFNSGEVNLTYGSYTPKGQYVGFALERKDSGYHRIFYLDVTAQAQATGTVDVAGTLAQTLGALTAAAAGDLPIEGSTTKTLDAATLDATGSVGSAPATGDLDATLAALTASAAGDVDVDGTLAKTLGAVTSSAAGELPIDGSTAATLAALTASAAGTVNPISGALTKTLDAATLDAAGSAVAGIEGSLGATLGTVVLSSAGELTVEGTAAQILASVALSAAGEIPVEGSLSTTLEALSLSATAGPGVTGSLVATLGDVVAAAAGGPEVAGSLTSTLGDVAISAAGEWSVEGTTAATLENVTVAAAGEWSVEGNVTETLGELVSAGAAETTVIGILGATLVALILSSAGTAGLVAVADPYPGTIESPGQSGSVSEVETAGTVISPY